jgi:hypothetical protein
MYFDVLHNHHYSFEVVGAMGTSCSRLGSFNIWIESLPAFADIDRMITLSWSAVFLLWFEHQFKLILSSTEMGGTGGTFCKPITSMSTF